MEVFVRFNSVMEKMARVAICCIMLALTILTFLNVVFRYCLGKPIVWAEEVTTYGLIYLVFLGIGLLSRSGSHISLETLYSKLSGHSKAAMMAFDCLLTIVVSGFLFVVSVNALKIVYKSNQLSVPSGIPVAAIYVSMPIGFLLVVTGTIEFYMKYHSKRD